MKQFSKEYKNWTLVNDDRFNITLIESKGQDLEDFLANAMIYVTDWHGNDGYDYSLEDLSELDYEAVVREFTDYLSGGV